MSNPIDPFSPSLLGPLVGPGSQPQDADGGTLEYMQMPEGMMTFAAPDLPEPEETTGLENGLAVLDQLLESLETFTTTDAPARHDLTHLDPKNLDLVNQVLGEGEVSVIGGSQIQAQEAVLAGVWRVRRSADGDQPGADYIEPGVFPSEILETVFKGAQDHVVMPEKAGPNIFNAPPLIPEINEHLGIPRKTGVPHVINLSLLPHTEEDLAFLTERLGRGSVTILSRGYGNCRITSTQTADSWWVQYYNSQDSLILNTIEISPVPDVACAASEDISDSAERLGEILEVYR
ncbi:hydrogenase expression/formation protein [Roseibium sp.]|uniref:hydrogenase expression/formation protein n=1 Tax=Roseibium sp. TaxID=1936156 RepID=UPI003B52DB12